MKYLLLILSLFFISCVDPVGVEEPPINPINPKENDSDSDSTFVNLRVTSDTLYESPVYDSSVMTYDTFSVNDTSILVRVKRYTQNKIEYIIRYTTIEDLYIGDKYIKKVYSYQFNDTLRKVMYQSLDKNEVIDVYPCWTIIVVKGCAQSLTFYDITTDENGNHDCNWAGIAGQPEDSIAVVFHVKKCYTKIRVNSGPSAYYFENYENNTFSINHYDEDRNLIRKFNKAPDGTVTLNY